MSRMSTDKSSSKSQARRQAPAAAGDRDPAAGPLSIIQTTHGLHSDIRSMIEQTRERVAQTVNAGMTLLYWRIGKRIQAEVLQRERADYGKRIVSTLSRQLGWSHFKEIIYLKDTLQQKLHAAIETSRTRFATEGGHSCPPPEK